MLRQAFDFTRPRSNKGVGDFHIRLLMVFLTAELGGQEAADDWADNLQEVEGYRNINAPTPIIVGLLKHEDIVALHIDGELAKLNMDTAPCT